MMSKQLTVTAHTPGADTAAAAMRKPRSTDRPLLVND